MDRDLREQIPARAKTSKGSLRSQNHGAPIVVPGAARLAPPALLAQLVEHLHGKEGVDGSSPSEGSGKGAGNGAFLAFTVRVQAVEEANVNADVNSALPGGRTPALAQSRAFAPESRSRDMQA